MGATVRAVGHGDGASVLFHDTSNHGQPEPGAALLPRDIGFEDAFPVLACPARAFVDNVENDLRILESGADGDRTGCAGCVEGIFDQINEDTPESFRIENVVSE